MINVVEHVLPHGILRCLDRLEGKISRLHLLNT